MTDPTPETPPPYASPMPQTPPPYASPMPETPPAYASPMPQAPPPYGSAYPQAFSPQANPARQGNGLALGSLITGIASLVLCGLGAVIGPVAIVLGIVSRRRSRTDSKAVWGIVMGAAGTALSILAIVSAVVTFSDQKHKEARLPKVQDALTTSQPTEAATAQAGGVTLTEAGVAASGFDTAYAAFVDEYGVSSSFDGKFQGDAIDTPCFTMGGEAWWVTEGEPQACAPSSELWWEYVDNATEPDIKLFGSGGRGATISFVPMTTEKLVRLYGSTDLNAAANDARDTMMPSYGCTDIVETPITLGGLPAAQLDCELDGYAAYRVDVVMLPEPHVLDDGTSISGFFVEAFNEAEWVYKSEDVFARLDQTLVWK